MIQQALPLGPVTAKTGGVCRSDDTHTHTHIHTHHK